MTIIYYRNKETGEIIRAHKWIEVPDINLDDAIEDYNRKNETSVVFRADVADDSLASYLFRKCNENLRMQKETIQDALDALEQALDAVRSLEV